MAGRDGFGAPSSAPNDASPADDYQTSPDDGDRAQAPSSRDGQSASRADFPPSSSRNDSGRNDFGSDYDSDQALQGSDGGLSSSGPRRDSRDDVGVHTDSDGYDPDSASNAPPRTSGAADQDLQSPSAGTLGRGGLDPGDDANLSDNELDAQRKPAGATDDYADPRASCSASVNLSNRLVLTRVLQPVACLPFRDALAIRMICRIVLVRFFIASKPRRIQISLMLSACR